MSASEFVDDKTKYCYRILDSCQISQLENKCDNLDFSGDFDRSGFIHSSPSLEICQRVAEEKRIPKPWFIAKINIQRISQQYSTTIKLEKPSKIKNNWMDFTEFTHIYCKVIPFDCVEDLIKLK